MPSGSAGGVFHCVAALLCAHHLPGQGPHAPRSHQWPDIHVHSQGRSWREGCPPLYPTFSQDGRKLLCTHEVGGTPSGCGRDVDYLRALGHVLSRAVPEPCEFWGVESFIHALSSLLPLDRLPPSPVWPPGSQSHPKPSSQPADSAVHHECHLIISLSWPLPGTPFSTRVNPHSAGYSGIPPEPIHSPGTPQLVLINAGGATALGAGQVLRQIWTLETK